MVMPDKQEIKPGNISCYRNRSILIIFIRNSYRIFTGMKQSDNNIRILLFFNDCHPLFSRFFHIVKT